MPESVHVEEGKTDMIPKEVSTSGAIEAKPSSFAEEAVRSILSTGTEAETKVRVICCYCTSNVAVLILTTFLFGSITIVQYYFGGVVTHSASLIADCNSMATDTLAYFLNIFAELAPPTWKRKLQLVVPILSLTILAGLTIMSFLDSLGDLTNPCTGEDCPKGPNPWIVWIFGLFGLIFDLISIWAFCKNKRQKQEGKFPVNMMTALMHVGADMIRSLTTTIEGLFLITRVWPADLGVQVDAWACMVITVVIVIGIVYGLYEVTMDIMTYLRTGE